MGHAGHIYPHPSIPRPCHFLLYPGSFVLSSGPLLLWASIVKTYSPTKVTNNKFDKGRILRGSVHKYSICYSSLHYQIRPQTSGSPAQERGNNYSGLVEHVRKLHTTSLETLTEMNGTHLICRQSVFLSVTLNRIRFV